VAAKEKPVKYNATNVFVDRHIQEGRGNKVAIYYLDQQITYGEVYEKTNQTGNAFKEMGLGLEDRVMLLLPDCPEFVYSFFGAIKIGSIPVPVNTMLKPEDYEYLLHDTRAKVIVVSDDLLSNITAIQDQLLYLRTIIVVGKPAEGCLSFDSWMNDKSKELETAYTTADDQAFWQYSSGTTGFPKGAVHLQHDMAFACETYGKNVLQITETDITYSVAKVFFAYGLGNSIYFAFYVGAATVLSPDRPLPDHVYSTITKYKPTLFFGVPTSYAAMARIPGCTEKYDLSSVRYCLSAGEPLPKVVYDLWYETWKLQIFDGIGTTEILHIYISNMPGLDVKPGSTGKIVPGYEAKILGEDGIPVAQGDLGTLMVKGDSIAAYYWNKHEKTKATFNGEWINTGDQYFQDEDGYYWNVGRGDDMIKAGGIWVSPADVENCLLEHPAVSEAGCAGKADTDELVKPKAYIVLAPGYEASPELEKELSLFVKGKIAPYKFPRWIQFISEMPRTATGKLQRFKLKEYDK
jgi:benzoate-CoA ligase